MCSVIFGTVFAAFGKKLLQEVSHGLNLKVCTHMSIEHLDLSQDWMVNDDTNGSFAYKPIASYDIYGSTVQRVRVYRASNDGKS